MHVRDRQTITLFTQNTCKKLGIEHGKQLTLEFKTINLKFKNMSIFLIIKLCLKGYCTVFQHALKSLEITGIVFS